MSIYTEAHIVPFVCHSFFDCDDCLEDDDLTKLLNPVGWAEEFLDLEEYRKFEATKLVLRGWRLEKPRAELPGSRNRITADKWVKGDATVYLLNESSYSNIGYFDVAIIANEETSICAFFADWKDFVFEPKNLVIKKDDCVTYTS